MTDYHEHMRQYRRFKAIGDWKNAPIEIDAAIQVCEVDEALPALSLMRQEAELHVKPQAWYLKLMGVRA